MTTGFDLLPSTHVLTSRCRTVTSDALTNAVSIGASVRRRIEMAVWTFTSPLQVLSALCCHIAGVIHLCSEEQMLRTDTPRVVAAVADVSPVRDLAVVKSPRKTVRVDNPLRSIRTECAVSGLCDWPCPIPAAVGFLDTLSESIKRWASVRLRDCAGAVHRARHALRSSESGRSNANYCSARRALHINHQGLRA